MWKKRIWRSIYTESPVNIHFANPWQPFVNVLLDIARDHPEVHLFKDDGFTLPTTIEEVESFLDVRETVLVADPLTMEETEQEVINEFDWKSVTKFRIKEDWVFDSRYSRMFVRILAIAPVREMYTVDGTLMGEHPIFWVYYPDIEEHLVNYESISPFSPIEPLTWYELITMRFFESFIYKESNVLDQKITDKYSGREAWLEAEEVKRKMVEFEEFLWHDSLY